jgi:hypothetical protein
MQSLALLWLLLFSGGKVIKRIPQRTKTDCAICVVAMVMAHPYSYERVLNDSDRYTKISADGKFYAWWETYLRDEGFRTIYRSFADLFDLPRFGGRVAGLLQIDFPHLRLGHIVAVDEVGIVDPAENAPDHIEIAEYVLNRNSQGAKFHSEFLAVERWSYFGGTLPL